VANSFLKSIQLQHILQRTSIPINPNPNLLFMKKILFFALGAMLASCNTSPTTTSKAEDGPTFGNCAISVDATFSPLIDSQLMVFHALYKKAHINAKMCSEAEAVNLLLADSVRNAIISRPLNQKELDAIKAQGFSPPKTLHIATDAVAVITHPSNPNTKLKFEMLQAITQGKVRNWSGVNGGAKSGDITIVFDNPNSSTVRVITDTLNGGAALPSNVFATNKTEEVINYVANNPNSIGFIGTNWIADEEDPTHQKFLKQIGVVAVHPKLGNIACGEGYLPFQAWIALKHYPLRRNIYSVCREPRWGLGTGFAAFLASDRGQRIVEKAALVPATMPIRLVDFKKNK
jgi:phosphate transport system substrate-binding protein